MNKMFRPSFLGLLVLLVASCVKPQQSMQAQITDMEKVLFSDVSKIPNPATADSMIKMYVSYADQFQDDTLAPEYLFRAGDIANGIGKPKDALGYFGRVQRYPNYKKVSTALFLQGFVSENSLADIDGARRYYLKFLAQYPNHKLATDVKNSLANLGKTPEEMIRDFEAKSKNNSDSIKIK